MTRRHPDGHELRKRTSLGPRPPRLTDPSALAQTVQPVIRRPPDLRASRAANAPTVGHQGQIPLADHRSRQDPIGHTKCDHPWLALSTVHAAGARIPGPRHLRGFRPPRGNLDCYLSDTPPQHLWPRDEKLDMQVIEKLLLELPSTAPIGLEDALTRYWNADIGPARKPMPLSAPAALAQWLSDTLKNMLHIQGLQQPGLTEPARETLAQIVRWPDREQRFSHNVPPVYAYSLESTVTPRHLQQRAAQQQDPAAPLHSLRPRHCALQPRQRRAVLRVDGNLQPVLGRTDRQSLCRRQRDLSTLRNRRACLRHPGRHDLGGNNWPMCRRYSCPPKSACQTSRRSTAS